MKENPSFARTAFSFFAVLGIIFIPFPFELVSFQLRFTHFIFGKPIGFIAHNLFGTHLTNTKVYSDSVSMYVLVLLLFMLALLLALITRRTATWKKYGHNALAVCYYICCYYLALQLIKYGAGKIFKDQFYLPEPNTLYTPMGKIDKDLLFWSSLGTSYSYNVVTGSVEALAGLLLLFKRTRLAGSTIGLVVLSQIVLINFSFDISVKLYSLLLVFLNVLLLSPYLKRIYRFFFYKDNTVADAAVPVLVLRHPFFNMFGKSLLMGFILVEVLYPHFKTGNFNDDKAARPYLHGAYEVRQVIEGTDTLSAIHSPVKRFFIHRNGYLIFQSPEDEMQDFKLSYDSSRSIFILQDYQLHNTMLHYNYSPTDSMLTLQYFNDGKEIRLAGKQLDWKKMPALQRSFHWTSDE